MRKTTGFTKSGTRAARYVSGKEEKERLKVEFDQEDIWIMQYEGRRI